jgi:imidazolonepropionase-like amidohydrolase
LDKYLTSFALELSPLPRSSLKKEAVEVDSEGGYLLPGLIDPHIHVHGQENVFHLSKWDPQPAWKLASF